MVSMRIIPALFFQFDKTGMELLSFGKTGRAPAGVSQFMLRGMDVKRQVTASIAIDFFGGGGISLADSTHLDRGEGASGGVS